MYVLEWRTVSALKRWSFCCLFPDLRRNSGNRHQNNTRVSTEPVRHERTYIIVFHTRHNESINDDKTTIFWHRPRVSLARFSFCWWSHNRLLMTSQWPGNCDAITWIGISHSLDVYFIHGDIHGRSRKIVQRISMCAVIFSLITGLLGFSNCCNRKQMSIRSEIIPKDILFQTMFVTQFPMKQ